MRDTWIIILCLLPLAGGTLWWLLGVRRDTPQTALTATRYDVVRKALSVWPLKVYVVMAELDSYAGPEKERVQWDAIDLSNGSLDHLERWLKNYDYREIISAAEYGDAEVLKRFEEQSRWTPDNESEVSFRDLLDTENG